MQLDLGQDVANLESIARTFPISGTFSPPQIELYSALLSVQKTMVQMCSEEKDVTMFSLHRESCRLLHKEMNHIGYVRRCESIEETLKTV